MPLDRSEWRRVAIAMMENLTGFEQVVATMEHFVAVHRDRLTLVSRLLAAARDEEADELFNGGADDDDQEAKS
jgi:hypothetical protein